MKCQNCGKNEADNRFVVNYMGNIMEVHICRECLEQFQNYAGQMMQTYGNQGMPFMPGQGAQWGFIPPGDARRIPEAAARKDDFPLDVDESLKERRVMIALESQLQDAIAREEYEEAARLRDEIYFARQKTSISVSE